MPRTIDEWQGDADELIRRVEAWKRNELEQVLKPPTGSSPNRLELESVKDRACKFAEQAQKLLDKPAADLPRNAEHKLDLLDIVEDCGIGANEATGATDIESVWRDADPQTKRDLTNRIRIPREKVDLLRARLRGERRGQPASLTRS